MKVFTREIVFKGHHDKLADQLSDSILQHYLMYDPESDINIDVVGSEDTIFITGNILNVDKLDVTNPIHEVLKDLNYSTDISIVDNSWQGKPKINDKEVNKEVSVYGYATNETPILLPKAMVLLQDLAKAYETLRNENPIFLPDGKIILEGLYENNKLIKIKSLNVNHQNTGDNKDLIKGTIYKMFKDITDKHGLLIEDYKINPYGPYYKGGFARDTGLTGSKLKMDNYQSFAPTSNFVMSGKSIYGIRAGIYKARDLAKTILLEKELEWCEVKVDYAANSVNPYNITVTSNKGDIKINLDIYEDFEPENIVYDLDLANLNYVNLASYGQIQD